MFGFPINLQSNDIQKFTNNADSGFPNIQQKEVFYSIKDGNWNDLTIWQTASGRVGKLPTANDDVYIRNIVTLTGTANITVNYFCNNLFISGTLSYTSIGGNNTINLYVNGNIRSLGTIDLRISSVSAILTLLGTDNYISNLVTNSTGMVLYGRNGDQDILDLPYSNLTITGTGVKKPTNHLVVSNTLRVGFIDLGLGGILDLWWWDLTVLGSTVVNVIGTNSIRKSYFGNILFVGGVNFSNQGSGCDFSVGSPNVEFRSGFGIGNSNPNALAIRTGTGTWTFTTNNQTINANNANFPQTLDCTLIIASGVTLTNNGGFNLTSTINGTDGTSRLVQGVGISGIAPFLNFATLASVPSMTIGTFDFTTNPNTIQYNGNYSATMPSYFTTFRSLLIGGTGTKTTSVNINTISSLTTLLSGNLTLGGNFIVGTTLSVGGGTFELSNYNLTVNGTTTIVSNPSRLSKSGSGNVIFSGLFTIGNSNNAGGVLNFSGGNPTVEVKNGMTGDYSGNVQFNSGTGTWTFTTNNQSLSNVSGKFVFNGPVVIANDIVLTLAGVQTFNSTINGSNANSKALNTGTTYIGSTNLPMTTGIFDITTFANTVGYTVNGDYTIPYGTYSSLFTSGTGTKSLGQNTIVNGNLAINGATDFATYDIDIFGTTTINNVAMRKSGAGNILFRGLVSFPSAGGGNAINFSGNPNVEFRNGLTLVYNMAPLVTGTGTWTFSTNNQTVQNVLGTFYTYNCSILISGITLTVNSVGGTFTFTGVINGTNASSILRPANNNVLNYQSATQPMVTGILDTSTNLNTWIYGLNNQDIKGSPTISPKQVYRNLTLNGTGVKTLQGYCSVLNTYTLTAPATLALNGFTLTNP